VIDKKRNSVNSKKELIIAKAQMTVDSENSANMMNINKLMWFHWRHTYCQAWTEMEIRPM